MENVIVLDFGGQYNQLIARRVREFNVYCELLPYTTPLEKILEKKPIGIIFTGGPASVFEENAPTVEKAMLEAGIPILGICYGCQLMAHLSGGKVGVGPREYGKQIMTVKNSPLFKDIPTDSQCWMSHTCYVEEVPAGFTVTATTATCPVAAMANPEKNLYGFQFHPESILTTQGARLLEQTLAWALQKLEHTNTLQPILEKLYQAETLSQQESHQLFSAVVRGELKPEQLAAALVSMKVRGESPQEIAGAATALLENAAPFPRPDYPFADIVGTGGDGSNSINISTASAFVAAACGLKVAKHGNRSVSSRSGSSDLLAAFGINLDMNAERSREALDDLGVCFLFAPKYHTGFRHAMPVRQQLKTRTLFNVLGPLINPAHPPLALIGVYSPELVLPIAETLRVLGYQRAAVVHSGGMDEVSLHAPTLVAELRDGEILSYQLEAADFGLTPYHQEALAGGTPEENRDILTRLLQGKGEVAHEAAVAANVAMLMRLHGEEDLKANVQKVLDVLRSGAAYDRVTALAARG